MTARQALKSLVVVVAALGTLGVTADSAVASSPPIECAGPVVETVAAPTPTDSAPAVEAAEGVDLSTWFPFVSPDGAFTVSFPGEPDSESQETPVADGTMVPLTFHTYATDDVAYVVSVVTYPSGTEVSLDGARDGSVANVGGTLLSSEPIVLDCRPGLEFVAGVTSGGVDGTIVSRVYAVDNVLYQLMVAGTGQRSPGDADIDAFFASFEFGAADATETTTA